MDGTLKDNRTVDIKLAWNGKQKEVRQNYPLSILLQYSRRAKAELESAAKTIPQGEKLEWTIEVSNYYIDLEIGSFNFLLRWLLTLPVNGYREEYKGKPQIPDEMYKVKDKDGVHNMITAHYIRIHEAVLELQLPAPITDQFNLRRVINEKLWDAPLTAAEFEMVFVIFNGRDHHLIRHACNCTSKFLSEGWMTPATRAEFEQVCQNHTDLNFIMTNIERIERRIKARRGI